MCHLALGSVCRGCVFSILSLSFSHSLSFITMSFIISTYLDFVLYPVCFYFRSRKCSPSTVVFLCVFYSTTLVCDVCFPGFFFPLPAAFWINTPLTPFPLLVLKLYLLGLGLPTNNVENKEREKKWFEHNCIPLKFKNVHDSDARAPGFFFLEV